MKTKLKILLVASEVAPFSKTGGLADVCGSLPLALNKLDCDVRIVTPKYKMVDEKKHPLINIDKDVTVRIGDAHQTAAVLSTKIKGVVPVYFIANHHYYDRQGLYGSPTDFSDNLERFAFFCRATLELIKSMDFRPDVIHLHDWQTALIPIYLKTIYLDDPFFKGIGTIFTVHNLGYQGIFGKKGLSLIGLSDDLFATDKLEFWGEINLLKGGLIYSDILTTVSKGYSKEIQTTEYGCGLDGILKERTKSLYGIINGLDYEEWNPATDMEIAMAYDANTISRKAKNKKSLQSENNLIVNDDIPVIGMVTRLADQKGLDILSNIIEKIMGMDIQFILLGTGDERYHDLFRKLGQNFPNNASIHLTFDPKMAKLIYAGSDMFLMPSLYEPCGLGQLISLRYGTVPIVRNTGGLADTIIDFDSDPLKGNGFVFKEYSSEELLTTINRAIAQYIDKNQWRKLQINGMKSDFSWEHSAKEYIQLYEKCMKG